MVRAPGLEPGLSGGPQALDLVRLPNSATRAFELVVRAGFDPATFTL